MWTTDAVHPVEPQNAVNDLDTLRLVRVSQKSSGDNSPLTGREWVVENIAGGGVIDASRATLNFDAEGKLYGRASCNNYSGQYEITGEELSVGILAVTQRACVPALNIQEQKFLKVLQNTRSFEIVTTGKLVIQAVSGETLEAYSAE